jgi:Kef-type K+ transport system membrane component KefB
VGVSELVTSFSLIFICIAVLSVVAGFTKQPLMVAYILAGILVGPAGLDLISDSALFETIGQVGIILLLFLLGLELDPRSFAARSVKFLPITLLAVFFGFSMVLFVGYMFSLTLVQSLFLATAFSFSSTAVVIKIIRDSGHVPIEVKDSCISILIIQDVLAVIALLFISSYQDLGGFDFVLIVRSLLALMALLVVALFLERYVVGKIFHHHQDKMDVLILLGLAWCFAFAEIAEFLHFSREIGAFIAGLAVTYFPKSKYKIFVSRSETLRDFFVILFFFVLGATVEWHVVQEHWLLILVLSLLAIFVKPLIYSFSTRLDHLTHEQQIEVGVRLGQLSEFSVIVALAGLGAGFLTLDFVIVIEVSMFISIVFSNYVVRYFPYKKLDSYI